MLHGGASQLPQGPQHSFKFYFMTPEKDAVAPKFELTLFLETTILTNVPYLLSCRELCQKDAVLSGDNEISCQ